MIFTASHFRFIAFQHSVACFCSLGPRRNNAFIGVPQYWLISQYLADRCEALHQCSSLFIWLRTVGVGQETSDHNSRFTITNCTAIIDVSAHVCWQFLVHNQATKQKHVYLSTIHEVRNNYKYSVSNEKGKKVRREGKKKKVGRRKRWLLHEKCAD